MRSNVVIGDVSSQSVGSGGSRVLSIQNGTPPAPPSAGLPVNGVQLYSAEPAAGTSATLHVMRVNGEVVKLYKETGLTASDPSSVGPAYGAATANVINNLRARIDQLEARLMNQGLLADPVPAP